MAFAKEEFQKQCAKQGVCFPAADDTSVLTAPVAVGDRTIPNRLVCQAMEGCDGTADGRPGELTVRRYERLARGGAGLIWFEATACMQNGRANPRQLFLCEKTLDSFQAIVERIKETAMKANGYAPVVIMQDTHSGRYSKPSGYPEPMIAHHNPVLEKDNPLSDTCIVTDDAIDRIGENLAATAVLAQKAGFDGVDIKCCHGYLNSELLSAFDRPGKYGGSFENRTRLLTETAAKVIDTAPKDFIVTCRLNVYDGLKKPNGFGAAPDGVFDPKEPAMLLQKLSALGMRLVNVTMGNPYFNPHINRPFAAGPYPAEHPFIGVHRMLDGIRTLKENVPDLLLIASALSALGAAAPHVAAGCIQNGWFDLAGFGRMIFAYPDFAKDILKTGELHPQKCCVACSKCSAIMRAGGTPGCVIRDREVYLPIYRQYCE